MRVLLPNARRRARIEIVPLIDVVFFLLATFVMVSLSMVKNQGIAVRLPSAATGAPQERKSEVVITITETGDTYLGKERMDKVVLIHRLRSLKTKDPELRVLLNGDEKAYFGTAISVLDELRKWGITKVSIQTKAKTPVK